jgi:hypothetical protein
MKNLLFLFAISLFATISFAQTDKKDDWIRVQSDAGEFSIEVPAKYGYFYDKQGTLISNGKNNYALSEMSVLNAYTEHTSINFECYKSDEAALDYIKESAEYSAKQKKESEGFSETKKDGYKISTLTVKNNKYYSVGQYFAAKNQMCILTASSRSGETPAMKHFLDSLMFKSASDKQNPLSAQKFSTLKITQIQYLSEPEKKSKKEKKEAAEPNPLLPVASAADDSSANSFLIISQPRPSYTDTARMNNEQGAVRFKMTFTETGQINKIVALKTLRFGLLRNAVFAALRMKIIPPEKDGKPVAVTKTMEYKFTLY